MSFEARISAVEGALLKRLMAHQHSEQSREGEQVLDADLAQHLGLLDWSQLDPIGEGQVMAGPDNEAGFFDDLGGEIVDDEGVLFIPDSRKCIAGVHTQ